MSGEADAVLSRRCPGSIGPKVRCPPQPPPSIARDWNDGFGASPVAPIDGAERPLWVDMTRSPTGFQTAGFGARPSRLDRRRRSPLPKNSGRSAWERGRRELPIPSLPRASGRVSVGGKRTCGDSAAGSVVHLEQSVSREDCRIPSQVCKAATEGDVVGFDSVCLTAGISSYCSGRAGIGIFVPEGP